MILELGIISLASATGALFAAIRHGASSPDSVAQMRLQARSEVRCIEREQIAAEHQIFELTEAALDEMTRFGGAPWK